MELLMQLVSKAGGGYVMFGLFGVFCTALLGFFLKRPIMVQAAKNEAFNASLTGMERLNKSLTDRNEYLEEQLALRDAYESALIQQLREARQQLVNYDTHH